MSIQNEVRIRDLERQCDGLVMELADMQETYKMLMDSLGKINSALDAINETIGRIHD